MSFLHIRSGSDWLHVTPWGLRKTLNYLKNNYNNVPIYITENGVSDQNGTLADYHRIHFYRTYINEVLKGTCLLISTELTSMKCLKVHVCLFPGYTVTL